MKNVLTPPFSPTSGTIQLQANPSVADPPKAIRRAVTMMGSNDLVVGEDHMVGLSCQRYNWQTDRCGSIDVGSSARGEKTLISNHAVLQKYPLVKKTSRGNPKEESGVEPLAAA